MKWKSLIIALCAFASTCGAYEARIVHVVDQLRSLSEVGSDAVGYAGTPHDFYLLYQYVWHASTDEDLKAMLSDKSPVVRIMGAKCIVSSPYRKIDRSLLKPLRGDPADVTVGPGGCVFMHMTVGEVVRQLEKDPNYLGEAEPHRT